MSTAVTHGIEVIARPRFEPGHSDAKALRHVFSYSISITNNGEHTVQLLRRRWHIVDALAPNTVVEGPGVVGRSPVLEPGTSFRYSSFCQLRSGFGQMSGSYLMKRSMDGRLFEVAIPTFQLMSPWSAS